jgi:non-ribosomal peptide synthetase component F
VLRALLTVDGQSLPVAELERRFGVRAGRRLAEIGREHAERLTTLNNNLARHEEFWVRALSRPEPIHLPYAHRSVSAGLARHASTPVPIPADLATIANHLPGWNAGDLLIAAFVAYLARLGGQREFDLGFGEPALQRELAGLPGLFATQVPLHVDLGQESSIGEALWSVREAITLHRAHKTYARDVAARYPELGFLTQRSWPGFPVVAEYVEDLEGYEPRPGIELALIVAPDGSACRWVYDPEVFAAENVAIMQRQFARVLRGVVEDRERPLGELPLLSDEERLRMLAEWNSTQADYPEAVCIHQLFEEQADRASDAVALIFEDQQLTYGELNDQANRLAHHLRGLGVGPEALVGICVERSIEMVVGLLSILKAGGAYVPLDPNYPEERLSFILRDAGVMVLLTQERLAERLPEHNAGVLYLDTDREWVAAESGENLASQAGAENLAYVIYTSGSTGRPKGVTIEHRALSSFVEAAAAAYGIVSSDRVLQFASPSFDASVEEIFPCLARGGALVLRGDRLIDSMRRFMHECREREISVLSLPTAFWHELVLAF